MSSFSPNQALLIEGMATGFRLVILAMLVGQSAIFAAEPGYLIKTTAEGKVYLDTGKGSKPTVGRRFRIFKPGEAIKHPVTGENLGSEEIIIDLSLLTSCLVSTLIDLLVSYIGVATAPGHATLTLTPNRR